MTHVCQLDFNCTIQELKHAHPLRVEGRARTFQLHHTGIKTRLSPR